VTTLSFLWSLNRPPCSSSFEYPLVAEGAGLASHPGTRYPTPAFWRALRALPPQEHLVRRDPPENQQHGYLSGMPEMDAVFMRQCSSEPLVVKHPPFGVGNEDMAHLTTRVLDKPSNVLVTHIYDFCGAAWQPPPPRVVRLHLREKPE